MLSSYEIIFFDVGGTLLHPYPSVGEIYARVASRYGNQTKPEEIEALFRKEWLKRDGLGSLVSHSNEKVEREWWHRIVYDVFNQAGGVEKFGEFFDELYDIFARPESWQVYPDSLELLKRLKVQGKRLGAISNWDSRLIPLLKNLALYDYFSVVLVSAIFGASKPHPSIFLGALEQAGVEAEKAIHIGDSLEDDIKGARAVGMNAILIDRHETPRQPLENDYQDVKLIRNFAELYA